MPPFILPVSPSRLSDQTEVVMESQDLAGQHYEFLPNIISLDPAYFPDRNNYHIYFSGSRFVCYLTPFLVFSQLHYSDQCTKKCFPGVYFTITSQNTCIL